MDNNLNKKGRGSALIPFLVFVIIYLGAGLILQSQGIKQLMAGGGVVLIGTTLIPLLSGLFG